MAKWRDIPGYEGYYMASDAGEIKSLRRKVNRPRTKPLWIPSSILKPSINTRKSGRTVHYVNLRKDGVSKSFSVHKLVMLAFVGSRPDGYETHHKDGDATNNRLRNLEYISRQDHIAIHRTGENHANSKLTWSDVRKVRTGFQGWKHADIANELGVAESAISEIKAHKRWKNDPLETSN